MKGSGYRWCENCSNSSGEAFRNKKNIEIFNCCKINEKKKEREKKGGREERSEDEKETWREWSNALGLSVD